MARACIGLRAIKLVLSLEAVNLRARYQCSCDALVLVVLILNGQWTPENLTSLRHANPDGVFVVEE